MYRSKEQREAHAAKLKLGLAKLGDNFLAHLCWSCHGQCEYEDTYTHGCGKGYYRAFGPCEYCGETGLQQGDRPAPKSILAQVLKAAGD